MVYYNNELDEFESYSHSFPNVPVEEHPTLSRTAAKHASPTSTHSIPLPAHALSTAAGAAATNLLIYPFSLISTRLKTQTQVSAQRRLLRRRQKAPADPNISDSDSTTILTGEKKVAGGVTYRKFFEKRTGSSSTRVGFSGEATEEEHYDGIFDAMEKIVDSEGIGGLYAGAGWDTVNTVAHGLWYFAVYNLLRQQRLKIITTSGAPIPRHLPILEELGIGILAAAASKFVSHPISTIVARKQTARMLRPDRRAPSFGDVYKEITKESGLGGLWSGYSAELLLTLNPSATFLIFETLHKQLKHHGKKVDKVDIFLLAAASKALATTLLYPLQIARIRAQLAGISRLLELQTDRRRPARIAHESEKGLLSTVLEIWETEGASALYVGLKGTLFKELISHFVTFFLKEAMHKHVLNIYFRILKEYRTHFSSSESTTTFSTVAKSHRSAPVMPHHVGGEHTKTHLPTPIVPVSNAMPKTVASVDRWMDKMVRETGVLDRGLGEGEVRAVTEGMRGKRAGREASVVLSGLGSGRTSLLVHPGSVQGK